MCRILRFLPLWACLCVLVTAPAVADNDIKDTVRKSFKVRSGGTFYLDADRGNVEIETTRDYLVEVEVERTVDVKDRDEAKKVLEGHELEFFQEGDDVRVRSRFERDAGVWGRWRDGDRVKLRFVVRVPERYNVDFSNGAGNVEIDDLDGEVEGRTGAGNVVIGTVGGAVEISTGSGNVDVDGAKDRVEVNTGAGNVTLQNVQGEVRANTGAGNIVARITKQPRGDSRLETGAGNVTVYLEEDISCTVDATASIGSAQTDFPLRTGGKWVRRSFEGTINGGGPQIYLRAGVGNVSLKKR